MKNNKKGFTIVELVSIVLILGIIATIFSVNFIKNLDSTTTNERNNKINTLESASDAYVNIYRDSEDKTFDDIKMVIANTDTFCYITIDELVEKGLIDEKFIDPNTGQNFTGVIKFTREENENYKFEYIEDGKGYITIVYQKNGADGISKTAQAIECSPDEDLNACAKGYKLPQIVRNNGEGLGWSFSKSSRTALFEENQDLSEVVDRTKVIDNYLYLYAISKKENSAILQTNGITIANNKNIVSCNMINEEKSCEIELPSYYYPLKLNAESKYYEYTWNTKEDGTGDEYNAGSKLTLENDVKLYPNVYLEDIVVTANTIKQTNITVTTSPHVNIFYVLDVSGSMSSNSKLSNLKTVVNYVNLNMINLNTSTVSIVSFESTASTLLVGSNNLTAINNTVNHLSASGGTNYSAALTQLNTSAFHNVFSNGNPNYVIFVSDGIPGTTASSSLVNIIHDKTVLYTIGIGSSSGMENALKSLSSTLSNGKPAYFAYSDTSDDSNLTALKTVFNDIFADITVNESKKAENAETLTVKKGILPLGNIYLTSDYPFQIYSATSGVLYNEFTTNNNYLYEINGIYYFDVENYALDNYNQIGLGQIQYLRFLYYNEVVNK